MKIKLNGEGPKKPTLSTVHILIILSVANLLFTGGIASYVNYSIQYKQSVDASTNQTAQETKNLIKAINRTDEIDDNRTDYLLNKSTAIQVRNYQEILNASNSTNTLVHFLTENFGANSGYLEKENFQYDQANKTFEMLEAIYRYLNLSTS